MKILLWVSVKVSFNKTGFIVFVLRFVLIITFSLAFKFIVFVVKIISLSLLLAVIFISQFMDCIFKLLSW